uniref:Uncharacterized protein n=1 Tax=Solanum tuberosum TaxID=4113 RepID=M1DP47_SOLTU
MGIYTDWSPVRDSTLNFENFEYDSSNIYGMTTVVDNKVLMTCPFCGLVLTHPLSVKVSELSKEVDQEITSHSTEVLQPVESHQLASPSRTIEAKRKGSPKKSALPKRPKKAYP